MLRLFDYSKTKRSFVLSGQIALKVDKYIIETEATVLDIDGEKWTIILNTVDYGSPEAKHLASEELWKIRDSYQNVVTGMKRTDGTYDFACSEELQEKIRERIHPNHSWTKVRLYPCTLK